MRWVLMRQRSSAAPVPVRPLRATKGASLQGPAPSQR